MKHFKHCLILLFGMLILPAAAFDWGGFLSDDTGIKGALSSMHVNQSNKLTLWMRMPVPKLKNSYFAAETFYSYTYKFGKKEFSHIWDISLLKFSLAADKGAVKTTFNIGRFGIADSTALIFSQPADGVEFIVSAENFSVKAYVGFTGLLNSKTAHMTSLNPDEKALYVYQLAPSAVIGSVFLTFPQLFVQQTFSFEAFATAGAKPAGAFLTAALNGPIRGPLFYILSTSWYFTATKTVPFVFSNLSAFELTAFLPFYSSMLSWKTVFATAQTGSRIVDFEHFSLTSANIDSTVKYAGHIKSGITASIRPVKPLLCTASGDIFFTAMNAGSKGFAGAQWQASVRWQIINDLQLSCAAGQFFKSPIQTKGPYMFANVKVLFNF